MQKLPRPWRQLNYFQSRTSDSIRGFVRPSVGWTVGWSVRVDRVERVRKHAFPPLPTRPRLVLAGYPALLSLVLITPLTLNNHSRVALNVANEYGDKFSQIRKEGSFNTCKFQHRGIKLHRCLTIFQLIQTFFFKANL